LNGINHNGGSKGEPFGVIQDKTGGHIILTKEPVFYEGDEERSSALEENRQVERERG
jgi:hypothetical protein